MAKLAHTGSSLTCVRLLPDLIGYNTPAAIGMAMTSGKEKRQYIS